jgi:anti-sigma regulatory factor (Ser/Thr protein kinase)
MVIADSFAGGCAARFRGGPAPTTLRAGRERDRPVHHAASVHFVTLGAGMSDDRHARPAAAFAALAAGSPPGEVETSSDQQRLLRSVPATPEQVATVRRAISAFAQANGASDETVQAVALAASEAATNVVIHAYRHRPEPGPLIAEAFLEDDEIVVLVCDEGRGMKPRPDSPGAGLGLPIIAQMAHRFEVSDRHGNGVALQMHFPLE